MFLSWLVVIAAIAVGIWLLVRQWSPTRRDRALDMLRERYARGGEITREEFEARRRDLAA